MKVARPISYDKGIFKFGFQYSFHSEVLQDKNKRHALEEIISKSLGEKISVEGVLDDEYEKRAVWEIQINEPEPEESPEDQVAPVNAETAKPAEQDVEVDVAAAFS